VTPETERTTHYFWSSSRNFRLDDAQVDAVQAAIRDTFLEDVAMVEAQQRAIEAFPGAPAIDISADAPTIQARRLLEEMIAAETAGRAALPR
jgi:vanillate O-demethylase monooxygenase subunit